MPREFPQPVALPVASDRGPVETTGARTLDLAVVPLPLHIDKAQVEPRACPAKLPLFASPPHEEQGELAQGKPTTRALTSKLATATSTKLKLHGFTIDDIPLAGNQGSTASARILKLV